MEGMANYLNLNNYFYFLNKNFIKIIKNSYIWKAWPIIFIYTFNTYMEFILDIVK
jgi:hypothetical protein